VVTIFYFFNFKVLSQKFIQLTDNNQYVEHNYCKCHVFDRAKHSTGQYSITFQILCQAACFADAKGTQPKMLYWTVSNKKKVSSFTLDVAIFIFCQCHRNST